MKLEHDSIEGTMTYIAAANSETNQRIVFYHNFTTEENWYTYSHYTEHKVVKTLQEAIALWNA